MKSINNLINSLRFKIAAAAAILSTGVVLLFAGISAIWFYQAQLDVLEDKYKYKQRYKPDSDDSAEEDALEAVGELLLAYLVALPVVVGVTAFGAWGLAGRLTQPLVNLADAADHIDAQSLGKRLPVPGGRDEIARLGSVLNELLARLEKSFLQSSRFAADASHELRTPLSIMRGEIEAAIHADPHSGNVEVLINLLEETQRLSAITDKLLLLARADAGKLVTEKQRFDLSELISEIAVDFAIIAEDNGLQFQVDTPPNAWVRGDSILLRQVFFNLFDNAIKYNLPQGWISAKVEVLGNQVAFTIANSSSPIPEPAHSHLFERFFRAQQSRAREEGGAGLGLSLCFEIAAAHEGTLELKESVGDVTCFKLTLRRDFI